ncbi:MAG: CRISPR-associated endonuclease Cas2 [Candidatus Paceibacterota bacterium]|jgi:DNA-binding transcriptional regulator PaaX
MRARNRETISFLNNVDRQTYSNAFEAFLFSWGSTSILRDNLNRIGTKNETIKTEKEKIRNRYRVMIYRLKKDGLIEQKEGLIIKITKKAKKLINRVSNNQSPALDYKKEAGNNVILIAFDVPEKFKRKRAWLRSAVKNIGFEMLQKSVWIGKIKIPKKFVEDLEKMRINEYVEILEIGKMGTIKKI